VEVGDGVDAVELLLKFHPVREGAEEVAEVQAAGGSHTGKYAFARGILRCWHGCDFIRRAREKHAGQLASILDYLERIRPDGLEILIGLHVSRTDLHTVSETIAA
jgi:hypothetical protein